jgi:thiol-disulfide isomerase/thioredoxin
MNLKKLFPLALTAALLWSASSPLSAAESPATDELKQIITAINGKLKSNQRSETELAPELKQFDSLLSKHAGEKTDEVAQILFMKATLYAQVLGNDDKARELLTRLQHDFPGTKPANAADQMLVGMEKQAAAKKLQAGLVQGMPFPDFNEKDLDGNPLSIANYKGKVLLLDFWATWCGPCRAELPNVLKIHQKHHANGFEIIGISLDQDRAKLLEFAKQQKMTWPQYFDGLGWGNKLAGKYGIMSIPQTFLLDAQGKIIARDLRGEELENAVAKALK